MKAIKLLLQLAALCVGGLLLAGGGICTLIDGAELLHSGPRPPTGGESFYFGDMVGWAIGVTLIGAALVVLAVRSLDKKPVAK